MCIQRTHSSKFGILFKGVRVSIQEIRDSIQENSGLYSRKFGILFKKSPGVGGGDFPLSMRVFRPQTYTNETGPNLFLTIFNRTTTYRRDRLLRRETGKLEMPKALLLLLYKLTFLYAS